EHRAGERERPKTGLEPRTADDVRHRLVVVGARFHADDHDASGDLIFAELRIDQIDLLRQRAGEAESDDLALLVAEERNWRVVGEDLGVSARRRSDETDDGKIGANRRARLIVDALDTEAEYRIGHPFLHKKSPP